MRAVKSLTDLSLLVIEVNLNLPVDDPLHLCTTLSKSSSEHFAFDLQPRRVHRFAQWTVR